MEWIAYILGGIVLLAFYALIYGFDGLLNFLACLIDAIADGID